MAKTNKKINKLRKRKTSRKIKRRLSKKRFSKKRFNRTRKRGGDGFHTPSSIRRKFEEAKEKGWDAVRIEEEIEKLKKLISDKDEFFEKFEVENRGNQSVDFDDWNKTYRPRAFEEIKTLEEKLQALKEA